MGCIGGRIGTTFTPYYYLNGGSQTTWGSSSTFSASDTVGFSMDFDNHEFKIYKTSDGSVVLTIDTSSITNSNGGAGTYPWYLPAVVTKLEVKQKQFTGTLDRITLQLVAEFLVGSKQSQKQITESAITPLTDATHVLVDLRQRLIQETVTVTVHTGTQSINVGFSQTL